MGGETTKRETVVRPRIIVVIRRFVFALVLTVLASSSAFLASNAFAQSAPPAPEPASPREAARTESPDASSPAPSAEPTHAPPEPPLIAPPPPAFTAKPSPAPIVEHPESSDGQTFDYDTSRLEPAGFPLIGGSSDIGVEFGAVGTLSKLGHGVHPYEWNMDLLVAISAKTNPDGKPELTQQNYLWQIDVPGLRGGTLRVNPAVSYINTINQGYFSLGNASSPNRPAVVNGESGRYFQYIDRNVMLRELTRIHLYRSFDLMVATTFRYEDPIAYAGSSLATDAAAGRIRGLRPLSVPMIGAGLIYDTRDNEYFPRSGSFYQMGLRGVQAFPLDAEVRYGALGTVFATYKPLGGPFVLAGRLLIDAQFGNVPFYDLYMGEPFHQDQVIGGSGGVRGVPEGRYLGRIKALANLELRAFFTQFRLFGQVFQLGGDILADTGRIWSDYTFAAPEDGTGIGLKWGVGGGLYLRWGQAGVFRIEAAYSPDAASENPSFPIGLYVQDGVMF